MTLLDALGMEIVEQTPERVVITMPITEAHLQPLGYLHGGVSLALAETAASIGASLNAAEGMIVFGQELNGNHIRSLREGTLTATSTPIHIGRSSQVWQTYIRDERDRLICVSRATIAVVPARRPSNEEAGQRRSILTSN